MSDAPPLTAAESAPQTVKRTVDDKTQLSPAMRQYQQFKAQHPGYVLFFRMGDFYEMFWEDANVAAQGAGRGADQPQQGRLEPRTRSRWRGCRSTRWRVTCAR